MALGAQRHETMVQVTVTNALLLGESCHWETKGAQSQDWGSVVYVHGWSVRQISQGLTVSSIPSEKFWGAFFLCLDQRPDQPLKQPYLMQLTDDSLLQSDQNRQKPTSKLWCMGFLRCHWEQTLAFRNQSQGEEEDVFCFSKDKNKKRPQQSSGLPFRMVRECHEDMPSSSCSHPRLFGWGDGHQLPHL